MLNVVAQVPETRSTCSKKVRGKDPKLILWTGNAVFYSNHIMEQRYRRRARRRGRNQDNDEDDEQSSDDAGNDNDDINNDRHRRSFASSSNQVASRSVARYSHSGPLGSVEGWTVFVTGVHEEAQEVDVVDVFSEFGVVKSIHLNMDRKTGLVKGYALVKYDKQEQAQDAINRLHGTTLLGKMIGVHWAFCKSATTTSSSSTSTPTLGGSNINNNNSSSGNNNNNIGGGAMLGGDGFRGGPGGGNDASGGRPRRRRNPRR
jgi:RNA recognition motif-containing protein